MNIRSIINSVYKLSDKSLDQLTDAIETVELPKGHTLLQEGKLEKYLYFLEKGIVRAYSTKGGEEVTFWFGTEGSIIFSMRNYIEKKPGYETIDLIEDCKLHRIEMGFLEGLYNQNIEIANWGRRAVEREIMLLENRLIDLQILSATERYQALMKNNPTLLQRVPLGLISSYLGITQVSLSRIRAKL